MNQPPSTGRLGVARHLLAGLLTVLGTLVWTHSGAGVLRAVAGITVADLAPASLGLTLGAITTAIVASLGLRSAKRAAGWAGLAGMAAVGVVAAIHPTAFLPALALLPAGIAFAWIGAWFASRLPVALDERIRLHPKWTAAWLLVAAVAVLQLGRLCTYMTDAESDWFLSTRHPFYAKHECANAYFYAAELNLRGEPDVYDAAHYPGLNRHAEPVTHMHGMKPEDPYQYPPQFLLVPQLVVSLTHDYGAVRLLWFGINITLCMGAVLALAFWVGGRIGTIAGLLTPGLLAAFPVLHNFQYGQFHFATIALAILGLLAFQRRRSGLGGTLLASSILAKLFPALLLVPLTVQRRWRDLSWTAGAGVVITLVALLALGTAPFIAFFGSHLPRLMDGSAFAFDEAWPELAILVTAGNQGIHGIVEKLTEMGVPGMSESLTSTIVRVFGLVLLGLGVLVGRRMIGASRAQRAVSWLGLLGLGSLASAGAWADYVPLTCVWVLAFLAPLTAGRPLARFLLITSAVMQAFLLGAMPLGGASDASWMLPLSLLGSLCMLGTFSAAVLLRGRTPVPDDVGMRQWPDPVPVRVEASRVSRRVTEQTPVVSRLPGE